MPKRHWESPISATRVAQSGLRLADIRCYEKNIFWLEGRPMEAGRSVVMRWHQGQVSEITNERYSVGNKVHEYGGAPYCVAAETLYFVNKKDQRIYVTDWSQAGECVAITALEDCSYADLMIDDRYHRLICIRECHACAMLISIDLDSHKIDILQQGHDFYAAPVLAKNSSKLAWLTWDFPDMPWDSTTLMQATITDSGTLVDITQVAGGEQESIFQPYWLNDVLYYVSDKTGWGNIYSTSNECSVLPMSAEFAMPQWVFGQSSYAFYNNHLVAAYVDSGIWHFIDQQQSILCEKISYIAAVRANEHYLVVLAGGPLLPLSVIKIKYPDFSYEVLRCSQNVDDIKHCLSKASIIRYTSKGQRSCHAFYYPPTHPQSKEQEAGKPGLIVKSHGGPSAAANSMLALDIQYWTSRGFAVVDVNYSGSTGYGKDYLNRLYGQWGVWDVEDCEYACRYLIANERVDKAKIFIRGSSAGGYVTLCALASSQIYKAGACYYGIADLELLLNDTHKFEARYLDKLIGPYPEQKARYQQRSPINQMAHFKTPIILFQGLQDNIVPPSQAEKMVITLTKNNINVSYVTYDNEGHGFREVKNIQHALESELAFYQSLI